MYERHCILDDVAKRVVTAAPLASCLENKHLYFRSLLTGSTGELMKLTSRRAIFFWIGIWSCEMKSSMIGACLCEFLEQLELFVGYGVDGCAVVFVVGFGAPAVDVGAGDLGLEAAW